MDKARTVAAPFDLSGQVLDLEVLRFIRDSHDRNPKTIRDELAKEFPNVPQGEMQACLQRLSDHSLRG